MASQKKTLSARKLTVTGMMVAITAVLAYTPLGIIPLQPISATTTHIPTIIIAILEGPMSGAITGLAFGLVSMFKAITQPTSILSPCFINPIVSLLPRVLIGIVAGYGFQLIEKITKKATVASVIASALGSLTNTLGVMGLIYVFYAASLTEQLGSSASVMIWGIITTYGIMEMLAAVVICTVVAVTIRKVIYRKF